jgi:hypothetical protein
MQATRAKANSRATAKAPSSSAGRSERELVESIFAAYGLPGWLGWGTYGAESSYGATTSGHFFGLIMDSYSGQRPNNELVHDTEISARLYKQLVDQYGSVAAAVPHYSGNSYEIGHVEQLGKGNAGGAGHAVDASLHIGPLQVWPPPLLESVEPWNWIKPNLGETPPGKEVERVSGGIDSIGGLIEFLTSGETWIRVAEVLAGALLIFLGLKGLSGVDFPAAIPVPV